MAEKAKKHTLKSNSGHGKKRRRVDSVEAEEEAFLEQEMIKKYRSGGDGLRTFRTYCGNRNGDVSMFIYRMYLLSHNKDRYSYTGENIVSLRSRTVPKPRVKGELLSSDIDRCWGRLDFGFECDRSYILSATRRSPSLTRRSNAQYTYYCENLSTYSLVSSPHCELQRPKHANDFVWIKDLNSEHGTFVNGKKIGPMMKYKLVEGDIVGLGISHDCADPEINVTHKKYFIMKVKHLNKSEGGGIANHNVDNEENTSPHDPMEFALHNILIVDKVIGFLKMKDLNKCRLLNRFWKSRADIKMVARAHLKFEFTYHPRFMTVSDVKWGDTFQAKLELMKNYKISSFEIDVTNTAPVPAPRQFHSDVQWFFDNMGRRIKDLILSMSVIHDRKGKAFQRIFSRLANVENLDLSLDINTSFYPVLGSLPLCLPSVKRLALWVHDVEGDDEMRGLHFGNLISIDTTILSLDPFKNHMISEIAKLFPNLTGITVKTGLLQNFLNYLLSNHQAWKNLTSISAEFEMYGESENPIGSYTMIRTLPQTLKKLQLDDIPPLTELGVTAFEQMLKKHSPTLELLCLKFGENGTDNAERVLKLPSFPRLTCFEIIIYVDDEDLYLKLQFPSGSISYERDFPCIKRLSLLPCDSISDDDSDDESIPSNVEAILNIFVPENSPTVSRTMTWVEFNLDKEISNKADRYAWYTSFLRRFQKIFPHVHHPDVIRGLQSMKP